MVVSAVDYAGNAKAASAVKPVKDVGISEDFTDSSLQIDGQPVPFQTATEHPVRKPSQVTIKFTQPVVTQWTDSTIAGRAANGGNPKTYAAGECVISPEVAECLLARIRERDTRLTARSVGAADAMPTSGVGVSW